MPKRQGYMWRYAKIFVQVVLNFGMVAFLIPFDGKTFLCPDLLFSPACVLVSKHALGALLGWAAERLGVAVFFTAIEREILKILIVPKHG